ncbi:MAG: DUF2062 domain-containing protein [Sphingomonadaceae bacterium]
MMRWLRKRLPSREALEKNRFLRPFAHKLTSPLIWRFNRRGVARGLALGLFAAFAVPIAQTPFAAAFALGFRANLPVAALSTLVTNPVTFPVIYVGAYQAGRSLLDFRAAADEVLAAADNPVDRWVTTIFETLGTTYLGLILFAIAAAALGYLAAHVGWRVWVSRRWAKRRFRRTRASVAGAQELA